MKKAVWIILGIVLVLVIVWGIWIYNKTLCRDCNEVPILVGGCGGVYYQYWDECCNNWAGENGIVHAACLGNWTVENNVCNWKCDSNECIRAGGKNGNPSAQLAGGNCCNGLIAIWEKYLGDEDNNCQPEPGSWNICSNCGNNICESWEDKCNCPVDCQ